MLKVSKEIDASSAAWADKFFEWANALYEQVTADLRDGPKMVADVKTPEEILHLAHQIVQTRVDFGKSVCKVHATAPLGRNECCDCKIAKKCASEEHATYDTRRRREQFVVSLEVLKLSAKELDAQGIDVKPPGGENADLTKESSAIIQQNVNWATRAEALLSELIMGPSKRGEVDDRVVAKL